MNAQEVIREVQENVSEWLEMTEDPSAIIAGVLANKIVHLKKYIEHLEAKLDYVSRKNL